MITYNLDKTHVLPKKEIPKNKLETITNPPPQEMAKP